MRERRLGGLSVGEVGFGCATISVRAEPNEATAVRALQAAIDAGVTLFDTADVYNPPGQGAGHSELLLRRTVLARGGEDRAVVATKGGKYWTTDGEVHIDGRPEYLVQACENSVRRLGLDCLPVYFFHEPDPHVPYAESIGALAELRDRGLVREVGLSNVTLDQLGTALEIVPVSAVENRFSPCEREHDSLVDHCARLSIAFLPWGSLNGMRSPRGAQVAPRFQRVATNRGVSLEQLVIAWLLARSPAIVPIPGCSRPESVRDSVAGADLELTSEERAELDITDSPR